MEEIKEEEKKVNINFPEPDYYGSNLHAMLGDEWFFGDEFYS